MIGEDRFFVGFAVVVGVFEDEEFVVGFGVAGFPMRVGGHGGHPEAALIVEGDLDGVGEVGEFFFGGEKVDLVAGGGGEGSEGVVSVEVFGAAVFLAGAVVGFDFGKGSCFGIGGSEIEGFSLGGGPDRLVAGDTHLLEFFKLGGVVDGAEGFVASSVNVDAIGDLVVFLPDPVFLEDGFANRPVSWSIRGAVSKEVLIQILLKVYVSELVQKDAIAGERALVDLK